MMQYSRMPLAAPPIGYLNVVVKTETECYVKQTQADGSSVEYRRTPAGRRNVNDIDRARPPRHVLELILLRLDSSISLVRAASACKRWCRVVADAGFQDRFRALRAPHILGHFVSRLGLLADGGGDPIFVPSPTWSSIHGHESLSLDFVPKIDGHWTIADSRDGLLLLQKKGGTEPSCRFNPALVVCNPLTRRYEAISCPPETPTGRRSYLGLFLVKSGVGRGVVSLSNFKVMAVKLRDHRMVRGRGVPAACVYSGKCGRWHDVSCPWEGTIDVHNTVGSFFFAGRANGSLYWGTVSRGGASRAALVLDEATAGVSQIAVPESIIGSYEAYLFRVIGSDDGTLRTVRTNILDRDVRVHARLHGSGGEWVLQTRVRLPDDVDTNY
ncbi:hypothetical protein HU200_029049 [Digitaria exilis]|uniref:F-box domain-containing protein n=1 Tax=Digitaria exilis TaxID=1010633 RepID=A0A835BUD7_9POAL|nr:hypothetical protein HU200_029049 [Digitaria exilis]